jgi:ornithine cyclodeaminase/alanine dehydrogenase-like protein (mu-crystallin family)
MGTDPARKSPLASGTLVLTRADVTRLLTLPDCIEAVEEAFRRHANGETIPPGVLGTHVEGGGFHVKAAGMRGALGGRPVYAAKVNANFPGNPDRTGLPTIQGVIALFDAADGRPLALLDSIAITVLRTAAATAVAAKFLAPDTAVVTICGCGEQSRSQLRALACVRTVTRALAFDLRAERAQRFARDMTCELGVEVLVVRDPGEASRDTTIWVTCTPARRWILGRAHVAPGSFVAAVGADNPEKQEIEPELLARSAVVTDVFEQCAAFGDLHHAIAAGLMRREDVRAELADVVSGRRAGRRSTDEIVVFDSTGTALQDVAAAALVYERAVSNGAGLEVPLGDG